MAGEGAVFSMITTLKNNRALVKGKGYYELRKNYVEYARRTKIDIKQITAQERLQIRRKMVSDNQKAFRKKLVAFGISILLTTILVLGIMRGIKFLMLPG